MRELDHAVERARADGAGGDVIRAADLGLQPGGPTAAPAALEDLTLEEVERFLIQKALARFDGNVSHAADALGLSRSALYRRLRSTGCRL